MGTLRSFSAYKYKFINIYLFTFHVPQQGLYCSYEIVHAHVRQNIHEIWSQDILTFYCTVIHFFNTPEC